MIQINSIFPNLKLPTADGNTWDLSENKAENFVMLVFYRGLHCPVCKKYNQQIQEKLSEFKDRGIEVIAISCDTEKRAKISKEDWGLDKLTLAYDLPLETAASLGMYISDAISDKEPEQFSEPALFILKPDRHVYAAYYQSMPFARPPLTDLLKGIDFILEKDYPPRGQSGLLENQHTQ